MSDLPLEREFGEFAAKYADNEIGDIVDIPQAVNSVSRSLEIADRLRKLAISSENIELVEAITELRLELSNSKIALADANEEVADLKQSKLDLEQRVKALETGEDKIELVQGKRNFFYRPEDEDEKYPCCPSCWLSNEPRISLLVFKLHANRKVVLCNTCGWGKKT